MNGGLEIISVAHAKEWKDFIESFEHTFNIMNIVTVPVTFGSCETV